MFDALLRPWLEPFQRAGDNSLSPWPRIRWGIFLLLTLAAAAIVIGVPAQASYALILIFAVILTWRFPYVVFYAFVITAPLFGLLVSLAAPSIRWQRVIGDSVDILLAELIGFALLAVWGLRLLLLWRGRGDRYWQPKLPLLWPYLGVVIAQALSLLSPAVPDPSLVLKYAFRPVFLVYLLAVVLPVNFIRTRRHLMVTLAAMAILGTMFSIDGISSLFSLNVADYFHLTRAHPQTYFAINALGGNHNALAEFLLFAAPAAMALSCLVKSPRAQAISWLAAGLMTLTSVLTFARSAWIVLLLQSAWLLSTHWRPWVKKYAAWFWTAGVLSLPVVAYMASFSLSSAVKTSTDARVMLADIAWFLFRSSPIVGVGAGSFPDRVSHVWAFVVDYGTPLDAHGMLQKLLAETGLIGLAAFAILMLVLARLIWQTWRALRQRRNEAAAYRFLAVAVAGEFLYQLFSTSLWTPRLWLPVGILIAAGQLFVSRQTREDPDFLSSVSRV